MLTIIELIPDLYLNAINVRETLQRIFPIERIFIMYMTVFSSSATIVHSRGTLKEIY